MRRGKVVHTTFSDSKAPCPLDRIHRQFRTERPNQLWVADFTYVSTWQGWLFVTYVIDVFAPGIIGWRVSTSMCTGGFVSSMRWNNHSMRANQRRDSRLIHHIVAGRCTFRSAIPSGLAAAGVEPSSGTNGDSYDT